MSYLYSGGNRSNMIQVKALVTVIPGHLVMYERVCVDHVNYGSKLIGSSWSLGGGGCTDGWITIIAK
jgi:hypothetical protein